MVVDNGSEKMWQKAIFTKQLAFHSTNQPLSSSQKLITAAPSHFMGPQDSFATFIKACHQSLFSTKQPSVHQLPIWRTKNFSAIRQYQSRCSLFFLFTFADQNLVHISDFLCVPDAPPTLHYSVHPNNTVQGEFTKFFIMQFNPVSCHFLPRTWKYSPQRCLRQTAVTLAPLPFPNFCANPMLKNSAVLREQ